ncbi:hypothetical protein AL66_03464 [Mycobacterium tuberculosis TKK_03_0111]|nr:hypothetical protein AL66_03464 [Mycobacterium tuberculosis TKK_03_0111]
MPSPSTTGHHAACGTGGTGFSVGSMRSPIRVGSGEPVLLLHPFLMSQTVWEKVAQQLADTGRFEVFAPTMAGHNGGPVSGTRFCPRRCWPTTSNASSTNWAGKPAISSATRWAAGSRSNSNDVAGHAA